MSTEVQLEVVSHPLQQVVMTDGGPGHYFVSGDVLAEAQQEGIHSTAVVPPVGLTLGDILTQLKALDYHAIEVTTATAPEEVKPSPHMRASGLDRLMISSSASLLCGYVEGRFASCFGSLLKVGPPALTPEELKYNLVADIVAIAAGAIVATLSYYTIIGHHAYNRSNAKKAGAKYASSKYVIGDEQLLPEFQNSDPLRPATVEDTCIALSTASIKGKKKQASQSKALFGETVEADFMKMVQMGYIIKAIGLGVIVEKLISFAASLTSNLLINGFTPFGNLNIAILMTSVLAGWCMFQALGIGFFNYNLANADTGAALEASIDSKKKNKGD